MIANAQARVSISKGVEEFGRETRDAARIGSCSSRIPDLAPDFLGAHRSVK
jgi:hypothetical protein